VIFAIDYRHAPAARWPAQIDDVNTSLAWIGEHAAEYGGDTSRVVLMGRSAGAHLALMAAYAVTPPLAIRGVVSYYGPSNLVDSYRKPPRPDPLDVRSNEIALLGGSLSEMPDRYAEASPLSLATRPLPPTLLVYGGADHIVEATYGAELAARLRATGTPVAYLEIPWAEHAFDAVFRGPSSQLALYYTERFLAYATR
jgi:acetyl esterase/lipase